MVTNQTNRNWTTTEKADISCYKAEDVIVECNEDLAVLSSTGHMDDPYLVQVFAIGDNLYIAHQACAASIYYTDSLKDCLDTACEMIYTS